MTTWNHRVCKETDVSGTITYTTYTIREAYYNSKGEIWAVTENGLDVCATICSRDGEDESDALRNLEQTLEWMTKALRQPVVDLDTIEYAEA